MANAKAYDSYEDVGMAFSDDDCAAYDPEVWATERVTYLREGELLLRRRTELDLSNPKWWQAQHVRLKNLIRWYCVALVLPLEEDEDLPAPTSAAGKRITAKAVSLEEAGFVGEWQANAEAALRYVVTIGRRSSKDWPKSMRSQSNKLANCVVREVNICQLAESELDARGVSSE